MPKKRASSYKWERVGIGHYRVRGYGVEVTREVFEAHLGMPRVCTWKVIQGNYVVGTTYNFADAQDLVNEYLGGLSV